MRIMTVAPIFYQLRTWAEEGIVSAWYKGNEEVE